MNFIISILVLLVSTSLFCWLFTLHLGLGPIAHLVFFFGGISLIGLSGIATLKMFSRLR